MLSIVAFLFSVNAIDFQVVAEQGSGFKVESEGHKILSNFGSVNSIINNAMTLSADSDQWGSLGEKLIDFAKKVEDAAADAEYGGGVMNQTLLRGFQSGVMVFPLLRFKSTKAIDTTIYTSVDRSEEVGMAMMDMSYALENLAEDFPDLEADIHEAIMDMEELAATDTDDTWIKLADVKKVMEILQSVAAKVQAKPDSKQSTGDMTEMIDTLSSELQNQIRWDAVLGMALSLNISMDFNYNFKHAEEKHVPEEISEAGAIGWDTFAMALYNAKNKDEFESTISEFEPKVREFGEKVDAFIREMEDIIDDIKAEALSTVSVDAHGNIDTTDAKDRMKEVMQSALENIKNAQDPTSIIEMAKEMMSETLDEVVTDVKYGAEEVKRLLSGESEESKQLAMCKVLSNDVRELTAELDELMYKSRNGVDVLMSGSVTYLKHDMQEALHVKPEDVMSGNEEWDI